MGWRITSPAAKESSFGEILQKIIFAQYTNPAAYPPLEHSSRILANDGWQVLFLSISVPETDAIQFPPHQRIETRALSHCPPGWQQKLHYFQFILWTLWWVFRWRPSWIYASDALSCPAALVLNLLTGVRVVYHEHDSPPTSLSASFFIRMVMIARRRLAHRSEICVLPNQKRAEIFAESVGIPLKDRLQKIAVVWNCPSLEEPSAPRSIHSGEDLWVVYQGTIVPPRLPFAVLEALTQLPEKVKLRIIGWETIGHRGYTRELLGKAKQLGLSNRVDFVGVVPHSELLAECRKCDIGLSFMPMKSDDLNEQTAATTSNKPFEYLICGLALLVSDLPEWRTMYVKSGLGLACNPEKSESIAEALRWLLDRPDEMRAMGERGRQKITETWSYEKQFLPVLERMNSNGDEFALAQAEGQSRS